MTERRGAWLQTMILGFKSQSWPFLYLNNSKTNFILIKRVRISLLYLESGKNENLQHHEPKKRTV